MYFFLISTISMLVVLGIMVLVHEFGHFAVAKLCGVRVEVFSVGFGKRLFGFRRNGTDYRLSLLPLGGYVKMAGENPNEEKTGDPGEFSAHPRWQRVLIGLAGPAANFLLALALMTGFYMMHNEVEAYRSAPARIDFVSSHTAAANAGFEPGDLITRFDTVEHPTWEQVSIRSALNLGQTIHVTVERGGQQIPLRLTLPNPRDSSNFDLETVGFIPRMQNTPVTIQQLEPGMPAVKAGLKAGDQITALDGIQLHSVDAMLAFLQANGGHSIVLSVLRDGKNLQVDLEPVKADAGNGEKLYRMGFAASLPPYKVQQLPPGKAFLQSVHFNVKNSGLILEVLQRIVTHHMSVQNLSGPIGIARQTGQMVEQPGWQPIIGLTAIISLNLGIVNLLPIPILDGGVIVLLLIEGIMRRDLNQEFKERIYQAAFVFLLLFFVFIMFNDISKLPLFTHAKP